MKKKSSPSKTKTERLAGPKISKLLTKLDDKWRVIDLHHLEKEFEFKDFAQALAFTNQVGELAEKENHHPDIFLTWGKVKLTIFSHSENGLTEGDFKLAAKIKSLE